MKSPSVRRSIAFSTLALGGIALYLACGGDTTTTDGGTDGQAADQNTPDVSKTDAAVDAPADVVVDAAPACTLSNPFAAPVELLSLNLVQDAGGAARGGHLSTDYLTAYYEEGTLIYTATRVAPTGDTFTGLTELASLDVDGGTSASPTVSGDGLTIYFSSDRTGTSQLYFAQRGSKSNAFGSPALVTGQPAGVNSSPFLQGDGSSLYFINSNPDAGTGNDIYRASVSSAGVIGSPVAVTELNTVNSDGPIAVTANGLIAYFSRPESPDGGPAAHLKVWTASRTNTALPFGNLAGVTEVEGPDGVNDDLAWVSNDGCQIILSSFRNVGSNLYIAIKP